MRDDDADDDLDEGPADEVAATDEIGRKEAATILKCALTSVRRLEESGDLVPLRETGPRKFRRHDVEALARARAADTGTSPPPAPRDALAADSALTADDGSAGRQLDAAAFDGRVAARVLARFQSGESATDVVVAEHLDPRVVEKLRDWYDDANGTSDDLVDAVRQLESDRIDAFEVAERQARQLQALQERISLLELVVDVLTGRRQPVAGRGGALTGSIAAHPALPVAGAPATVGYYQGANGAWYRR